MKCFHFVQLRFNIEALESYALYISGEKARFSDLGKFRCTNKGIALLQKFATFSLVIKGTVMGLGIAVAGTEVVSTSEKEVANFKNI